MTRVGRMVGAVMVLAGVPGCYQSYSDEDGGDGGTDRVEADAADAVDAEAEADTLYCPDPARPNADVEGTTPLGRFASDTAVFGRMGGECGGFVIYLLVDPTCLAEAREHPFDPFSVECDQLAFYPETWSFEAGSYVGTGPAHVTMHVGEETRDADGVVTITVFIDPFDPFDPAAPPVVEGEFRVVGDGWDLGGSFRASWCEQLNVYCP